MVGRLAIASGSTDIDLSSSVDIKIPSDLILHLSPEAYGAFHENNESRTHQMDDSQSQGAQEGSPATMRNNYV